MNINYNDSSNIFDEYNTPVFSCDKNFNILTVNKFIKNSDMNISIGQHINDIFSSNSIDLLAALEKANNGLPYLSTNFEYNLLNTTLCMFPVIKSGELQSIVCFLDFLDLNEPLHSYVGSVTSVISDRYRSPIAGIMNVSAILARRFQEMEDYKSLDYLNHIAHCCYLMLNTSVSVQEYYMLVNSKRDFKIKKLVLNTFLENLCRALQVLFVNSSFKLEFENCEEEIITKFDEDMLSLAIFQIISNSCNFSPNDSTIKIAVTKKGDKTNITITDEGIGIDKKIIDRVFDPFFSVHSSPVPEENMGIGLGLPIAKKIIEKHNGQIFITSEVNQGTVIVISLPITDDSDDTPLTLNSDTAKYVTDKFSNIYLLFANICNIKLY